ncbi:MAG: DNA mismatch repair endonuclease MutL [Armatimonadetes bacterium]|nr:DNA mismatch repair endonuclease MutL [Armatimonadota bacterium]
MNLNIKEGIGFLLLLKMGKINLLDKNTSEKISAGEIIERPASIVKELIENSIDAESKEINISIHNGGIDFIEVSDDGIGMEREDAVLSLKRFATSKIQKIEDLENLNTLGFRGEALPSIAAISKMEILTKHFKQNLGVYLKVEGGEILKIQEAGIKNGTTIKVNSLFYNTPARKKFLKSKNSETAMIVDLINKFALFYQNIFFKLNNNGKIFLNFPLQLNLKNRLGKIFKINEDELLEISSRTPNLYIDGLIAKPYLNSAARTNQIFFVNGRIIKNSLLSQAFLQGCGELLPKGRFPQGAIFIQIDHKLLDVNIHPAKAEVRFLNSQEIFQSLSKTVASALRNDKEVHQTMPLKKISFPNFEGEKEKLNLNLVENLELNLEKPKEDFIPLAQIENTYIIGKEEENLWIIDQHTAAERINFENLKKNSLEKNIQKLLIPQTLELTLKQKLLLEKNINLFEELGFELDFFGGNAFLIRSIPASLKEKNIQGIIQELIEDLEIEIPREFKKEKLLKELACKSALKAKEKLNYLEMQELFKKLKVVENHNICPHGRPVFIKLNLKQLNKMFGR